MVIPFYSSNMEQLIHFLEVEAQNRGRQMYYFLGYNNPEEEMRLVGRMIFEGYEAVIVVPNYDESHTADFYRKLIYGNTTVLLVDNTMSGSYFRYVVQSYDLGVKRAVDYLVSDNQGDLVMVKSNTWKGRNLVEELMEQTFKNLISASYPDRKVHIISQVRELDRLLFIDNKIGGILTASDADSIRVMGRLKKWGIRVPDNTRLVNYGNTELTLFFDPPITVIDCQYEMMAKKTANLIDLGRDAGSHEQHIIQPKLIIRAT
jgi:DNA-binding LacI/PurR family transcriptional regulator